METQKDDTIDETPAHADEAVQPDCEVVEVEANCQDEDTGIAPSEVMQSTQTPDVNQVKAKEVPIFANMLMSPIVTLIVGPEGHETHEFTVHRDMLTQCKHFSQMFESSNFVGDASPPTSIPITEHDHDTVGFFLEYLYTGEYTPRKLPNANVLEGDTDLDTDGEQLLRHARIYALSSQFGLPYLTRLARYKIGCVEASSFAEIMFARFVYAAGCEDLKESIVRHWASVDFSEIHAVEAEFKALGTEFPGFLWDVLCRRDRITSGSRNSVEKDKAPTSSSNPAKRRRHGRKATAGK